MFVSSAALIVLGNIIEVNAVGNIRFLIVSYCRLESDTIAEEIHPVFTVSRYVLG